MKIVIDLLYIRDNVYTGIGNVGIDLVSGLLKYPDIDVCILTWVGMEEFYRDIGLDVEFVSLPIQYQKTIDNNYFVNYSPRDLNLKLDSIGAELVFCPRYYVKSLVYPKKYRQICVVHDIQHVKLRCMQHKWIRAIYYWLLTLILYHKTQHLIAISHYTKREIKKFTGCSSEVIYNSVNSFDATAHDNHGERGDDQRYILDVNNFLKYKNTERLIDAFASIKDRIPHQLYLKGSGGDTLRAHELREYVERLGLKERVVVDITNYSSQEMASLYSNADLFVSPSTMEGFGLTPVEAALYEVPVIVSDIDTLREVTAGKVKTFNPLSVSSIAAVMLEALLNPPSKQELRSIAEFYKVRYSQEKQLSAYVKYFNRLK